MDLARPMHLVRRAKRATTHAIRTAATFLLAHFASLGFLLRLEATLSRGGLKSRELLDAIQSRLSDNPLWGPQSDGRATEGSSESLRVVIPIHSKDVRCLALTCAGVLRNARPRVSEVLVVTNSVNLCASEIAKLRKADRSLISVVNERDVFISAGLLSLISQFERPGWVLQQAIKFQVVCESELPVLVLDSDTVLIAPRTFLSSGRVLLMVGNDCHRPYYRHIRKYFDAENGVQPLSFVTHHQLMQPRVLLDMFSRFGGLDRFLALGLETTGLESPVSEYQTYGAFSWQYWRGGGVVLGSWSNRNASQEEYKLLGRHPYFALDQLEKQSDRKVFSVSFHSYLENLS